MKKLTAATAALLLAACGAETDPVQQYRDALPKAQAVQLGTPQAAAGTAGALSATSQPLGDSTSPRSEYATMSYYLALTVNGGVAWTLAIVQYVTAFPPTSCGDGACTWGPWVDEQGLNRWKLTVAKADAGAYAWALSAQPGSRPDAAFVDLVTGTARPVDRTHGSGAFTVNFDAQDALDHGALWRKDDFGTLAVTYDNTKTATVGAQFVGAHNKDPANPHLMNAAYAFEDAASGGQLQVAFEDVDTTATVSLRTRWSAGGAGRADAHLSLPDGAGGTANLYASECWAGRAQDFVEVYDSKHPEIPALADENACSPFSSASYANVALP